MSEPRFFTSVEPAVWRRTAQVSATVALLAALLMAVAPGTVSLVTFALLTFWCHGPLSPLLPATYEPVLLGYSRVYPPFFLAVLGAVASTAVEFANYHLYQKLLRVESVDRLLRRQESGRLMAPFHKRPFLTVWLCVLTPLPDWATRVLASHSGYSVRRYLSAVFLARLPRFWFLAALGVQLELGAGILLWIVAGSAGVTLFGIARRHIVSALSKPAIPAAAALLLAATALLPGKLDAQGTSSRLTGPAQGVSMDWFGESEAGLMAMSYRFSSLQPGTIGLELGVSVFPQTLPAGVLFTAPDLGAAYNLTVPGGSLLIKAGGSAVAAVGAEGTLFIPGVHLGGTLLLKTGELSGVRLDLIRHYYWPARGEIAPVWSIGLGFAILPDRKRS